MKKILFAACLCFAAQVFAAPADTGCISLQNSNWNGQIDYMNGNTEDVAIIIQSMSTLPNGSYSMSGNINGEYFNNALCIPNSNDPTQIAEVFFNSVKNNSQSSLVSMFFDNSKYPKQISNLMGTFDGNPVVAGTISRS